MTTEVCHIIVGVITLLGLSIVGFIRGAHYVKVGQINSERNSYVYWRTLQIVQILSAIQGKPKPKTLTSQSIRDLGYWTLGGSLLLVVGAVYLLITAL